MKNIEIAKDEYTNTHSVFTNDITYEQLSEDELVEVIIELSNNDHGIFLELLRRSGITNMFGATPYLMNAFDLTQSEAIEILANWMKNYN